MSEYRLVLMDEPPEYRVCLVTLDRAGRVTGWERRPTVAGRTQEEAHAAHAAMHGAFYSPVLRESELP